MEILQSAQFLFFVGPSLQPCSKFIFERQHSKRIRVEIEDKWQEYILEGKVDWPGKVVLDEAGRFKVQLPKRKLGEWSSPGKEADDLNPDAYRFKNPVRETYPVTIRKIIKFRRPGICELVLTHEEKVYHYFYPGQYLCIYLRMKGKRSKVPFYPTITFPFFNLSSSTRHARQYEWTNRPLRVFVNDYGRVESFQNRLCDKLEVNNTIYVSYPKGGFCVSYLRDYERLNILTETIGIGPVLSIALYVLQTNPLMTINMIFFSHQETDEIYRDELEDMAKREPRFQITYVHKLHRKGQGGWKGSIQPSSLKKFIEPWSPAKREFAFTSGHRQFVFPFSKWLVTEYGYPNRSIYRFITI